MAIICPQRRQKIFEKGKEAMADASCLRRERNGISGLLMLEARAPVLHHCRRRRPRERWLSAADEAKLTLTWFR